MVAAVRPTKGKMPRQLAAHADYFDKITAVPQRVNQTAEAALGTGTAITLTGANLAGQLMSGNPGSAATYTLPTGTNMDAALDLGVNEAFDCSIVGFGAGGITVATATGWTLVGSMAIAAGVSGRFRVRKTAAATFTLYRLA